VSSVPGRTQVKQQKYRRDPSKVDEEKGQGREKTGWRGAGQVSQVELVVV